MSSVSDKDSVVDETLVHLRKVFCEMLNADPKHAHELVEYHHDEYRVLIAADYSSYAVNKYRVPLIESLKRFILNEASDKLINDMGSLPQIKVIKGFKIQAEHPIINNENFEYHVTYITLDQSAADILIRNFDGKKLRQKYDELRYAISKAIKVDKELGRG